MGYESGCLSHAKKVLHVHCGVSKEQRIDLIFEFKCRFLTLLSTVLLTLVNLKRARYDSLPFT